MTLLAPNEPYCLFEDGKTARLFKNPREWVTAYGVSDIKPTLRQIQDATTKGMHAAGYLAYEAAAAFEDLPTKSPPPDQPLLCFGLFDAPDRLSSAQLDDFWRQRALEAPACSTAQATPLWNEDTYAQALRQVHQHLSDGDIYQANITFPLDLDVNGSAEAFYARLRRNQPAAYSAFMALPGMLILSLSPERFFAVDGGRIIAQPMKGTAPIDAPGASAALQSDPKNRAENLMITDLLRNDLSRVAAKASVQVPALFQVERLPSLYQMTSKVTATLKPETPLTDLLAALFPCGSVTGAPKRSAMEVIKRLESPPRGVYCGAIGMIAPSGDMTFNVPIRTIVQTNGVPQMSVGSGVVADSDTHGEFEECLLKAAFLTANRPDFALIETMGWGGHNAAKGNNGADLPRYWPLHRARLEAAADYFGFPAPTQSLDKTVREWLETLPGEPQKIRLLYSHQGAMSLTATALPQAPKKPMAIRIGQIPADAEAAFLKYKTTNRAAYSAALAEARRKGPCDEAFLLGRGGLLSEGTYTNIFIQSGRSLLTPRATGRFLPGVLRAHLLATGAVVEADLSLSDLRNSDAFYAGNALRGLVPAILVEDAANSS